MKYSREKGRKFYHENISAVIYLYSRNNLKFESQSREINQQPFISIVKIKMSCIKYCITLWSLRYYPASVMGVGSGARGRLPLLPFSRFALIFRPPPLNRCPLRSVPAPLGFALCARRGAARGFILYSACTLWFR